MLTVSRRSVIIPNASQLTPFSFVLPESFDPAEFLTSPELRLRQDDARYFVNLILTKLARQDVDERGLVRLMAVHLKNIMYQGSYAAVIKALTNGKAIERFPYHVGETSFGFRLGERFVADRHIRVSATDSRLVRRLNIFLEHTAAERETRMKPVHRELAIRQTQLEIHGADARQTLEVLPKKCNRFDTQGVLIADIENREFRCNVGRHGRMSNNITSLKRELRSTLHVNGEPLVSVDLSCAQPALLAKVIKQGKAQQTTLKEQRERNESCVFQSTFGRQHKSMCRRPQGGGITKQSKYDSSCGDDLERYTSLVQSGNFYDFMVDELSGHGITRDAFKRRFLADVIAKRGRYPSVVEDCFRDLFPNVYQFVRYVNRDDHATLIRLLQEEESQFVIDTVAAVFVARHPTKFVIPLHDALYTTPQNLSALKRAFDCGFDSTGFRMKLKAEA